jgi:HPt (histidine-containing phosphotransfer) domain-containing protein
MDYSQDIALPDGETVDPAVIARYRQLRPGFLERLINAYFTDAPQTLSALQTAVAMMNLTAAKSAAHALKSSSANLGAVRLSRLCQALEDAVRDRADANVVVIMKHIIAESAKADQGLRAILQSSRSLAVV